MTAWWRLAVREQGEWQGAIDRMRAACTCAGTVVDGMDEES